MAIRRFPAPLWIAVLAALQPCAADTIEVGPGDGIAQVLSAFRSLRPGDELVLKGGTYELGDSLFRFSLMGTPDQPITVRARDAERPRFHRNTDTENIIDVDKAAYATLRGIEFSGGSAGIRISGADHFSIEDCEIHDTGDVALRANDPGAIYDSVRFTRNHVHHTNGTGEGMYLGCNNNQCQFRNGLIEGNYIHHTNGADVEQGDGIEIKEGSSGNIVRNNVIHDTRYPGILVYSTAGNGPPNLIEGNVVWNARDHGIQAAADARIRNNIVIGSSVSFQRHQAGSPGNIEFVHNTVISPGTALLVRNITGPVLIANNALYSRYGKALKLLSGDRDQVTLSGNMGTGGLVGARHGYSDGRGIAKDFINGHYGTPPMDLYPAYESPLIGGGNPLYAVSRDFNGMSRLDAADVGAYAHTTDDNPGWALSNDFKPQVGSRTALNDEP